EGRGDDRLHVLGKTHRSRPHSRTFRAAGRDAHRELHHREVWVVPQAAERKALATGLQKLNENMLTLAELSELAVRKAVDGLTRFDLETANEVFTLDQEVYGLQLEIERNCNELLQLYARMSLDDCAH